MPDHPLLLAALFFVGGAAGSFLGVCVLRIPKGASVISPGSVCESCKNPVAPFANIPVLGFVICRGACLKCRASIPPVYPVLEGLCAVAAAGAVWSYGLSLEALKCFVFVSGLATAATYDLETMTVPDFITLPLALAGVTLSIPSGGAFESLAGAAAGGGVLFAVSLVYRSVRKRDGMGGGDIKLMAAVGAFTGAAGAVGAIFIASAAGAVCGLAYLKIRAIELSSPLPFAPFIAAGGAVMFFMG